MILEEVKKYIRVDFNDDDDYINLLIEVAKEYVSGGFAPYSETNASHKLLALKAIKTLYDESDDVEDRITVSIRMQQMFGTE
ncbi:MAG: head-tail connector protein [Clostridium sp.]